MKQSWKEHLGQHLILGFETDRYDRSLQALLETYQPGGLLLFARNLRTGEQTAELLRQISTHLPYRPFLALDQEGGSVDRLKGILSPLPSAERVLRTGKRSLAYRLGEVIGEGLRRLGFNLNFAPVLDLAHPVSRSVLGSRTFGEDGETVTKFANAFLEGLSRHQVLSCGKHFPGLGGANADTHFHLPVVDKPMKKLWQEDLIPYCRLSANLPLIMVSHACYKAYDFQSPLPACLSPAVVDGLLRRKLGYSGLVVTDDMNMGAITRKFSRQEAALRALEAGCDMLVVGRHEGSLREIVSALESAVKQGRLSRERLQESREKIARLQRNLPLPPSTFNVRAFEKLNRKFVKLSEEIDE